MKSVVAKLFLLSMAIGGLNQWTNAQNLNTTAKEDPGYVKVIQQRVSKIVEPLHLKNQDKAGKVQRVIEQQYFDLNRIDQNKQTALSAVKTGTQAKQAEKAEMARINENATASVDSLHPHFVSRLNKLLNKDQVAEVKDGMTYHTLEVTYGAYTDMLPQLTSKQKKQIMQWLEEAREHAIDGGSSKEKHAWFGKYKGRINNYLSKSGIDMKEAEVAWKKRRDSAGK
ncbi:Protein of unknown function [Arachidicoccus rhizosphaerae]|uniref:DUF3826 domain-containing protein n=1 Tax=Arachidicoccus rhizosphaerae TaxID=551991 RepID=A0A1H3X1F4_9BACT|nr:DUF3826 domain-containing protein [Arachidicoccus rhizosphaerae]SDZ93083.1 Protein of unknown function [Arachidicoccus rhizosphaerae]